MVLTDRLPAQDGRFIYGGSLSMMEIVTITPEEYREISVEKIAPLWSKKICAVHTFDFNKDYIVVDAVVDAVKRPERIN